MPYEISPPPSGRTPIRPNYAFDPDAEGVSPYAVRGDDPRVNRLGVGAEPQNPTNAVFEISTPAATAGTFRLHVTLAVDTDAVDTAPISFDAATGDISDALDAVLAPLGYSDDDWLVEGGPLQPGDAVITLTFRGGLGARYIGLTASDVDLVDGSAETNEPEVGNSGTTGYPIGALIVGLFSGGALWVNLGGTGLLGDPPNWQPVPGGAASLEAVLNVGNDADGTPILGLPAPTDPTEAANKTYVDANAGASLPIARADVTPNAVVFPYGSGGAQVITPATATAMILGAPTVDTDSYWDGGAPDHVTVPLTGLYRASFCVDMGAVMGFLEVGFIQTGSGFDSIQMISSARRLGATRLFKLNAGNDVYAMVRHSEGGNVNGSVIEFSVEFLGVA